MYTAYAIYLSSLAGIPQNTVTDLKGHWNRKQINHISVYAVAENLSCALFQYPGDCMALAKSALGICFAHFDPVACVHRLSESLIIVAHIAISINDFLFRAAVRFCKRHGIAAVGAFDKACKDVVQPARLIFVTPSARDHALHQFKILRVNNRLVYVFDNLFCKIRRSEMSVFFYPNYRRKVLITWQYSEWKKTRTTVMSNHHLRNPDLSLKSKRLLSQMLSLPEEWGHTLKGLFQINREGIDAISCPAPPIRDSGCNNRAELHNRKSGTNKGKFDRNQKCNRLLE